MEDSPTTDATLRVFREIAARFPGRTGVVLQSRLRRTLADAVALGAERANIRLCKGIYLEPRPVAYEERDIIRNAFVSALRVAAARRLVRGHRHPRRVARRSRPWRSSPSSGCAATSTSSRCCWASTPSCAASSSRAATRLRVYVPFGTHWYPYSVRRLRENPTIVRAGLQGFLRGRLDG